MSDGVDRPVTQLVSRLPITEAFEAEYLEFNGILPLEIANGRLRLAVAGEPAVEVLDDLERSFFAPLEPIPVSRDELAEAIRRTYAAAESIVELVRGLGTETYEDADPAAAPMADARDLANQPPVIRFVNLLIREAHAARASDVHLESLRGGLRTRFRIDGVLQDAASPPAALQAAVRTPAIAPTSSSTRRCPEPGVGADGAGVSPHRRGDGLRAAFPDELARDRRDDARTDRRRRTCRCSPRSRGCARPA